MKASILTEYGPPEVLQYSDVPKPEPKDYQVVIKVHATSVNFGDLIVRNFKEITPEKFNMPFLFWLIGRFGFGINRPRIKILGSEFSGVIESTGKSVKSYKVGDEVFGYCGSRMGAYAQYLLMNDRGVMALKPTNMSHEEAASIPYGSIMALNILKKYNLQPGQKVLINGASGGIGPILIQLAVNHFGAQVDGVCGTKRVEYVKNLGTSNVIDYTCEDFTVSGEQYDFIIDILGKCDYYRCRKSLSSNGKLLYISFKSKQFFQMIYTSVLRSKKVCCVLVNEKPEDLETVKKLVEAGKVKPFIDKCYTLDKTADAHRYAQSGSKTGSVIITVS